MIDPNEAKAIIEQYFAEVTDEQFEHDLRQWCPEVFDERYFTSKSTFASIMFESLQRQTRGASLMTQSAPPPSPKDHLPTMYDLPSEALEEPGLPDELHILQPQLLSVTFWPTACPQEEIFTASDLNFYYDLRHLLWYKRPDWFAVIGVPSLYEERELRRSYVLWQRRIAPTVVIEFLSPGTEAEDLGQSSHGADEPPTKWQVYERILRVPYYIVFDGDVGRMRLFQLLGIRYQEVTLAEPRFWFEELGIGIGLWRGFWLKLERPWLRWFDERGQWIATPEEQPRHRAEQAEQEAGQLREQMERLKVQLRSLGLQPDHGPAA